MTTGPSMIPKPSPDSPLETRESVLSRLMAQPDNSTEGGGLADTTVTAWADTVGTLADGRTARLGASCLIRPSPGDKVLVWGSPDDDQRWVLAVLERPEARGAVLATPGPLTIQAPRVGIHADAVHLQAEEFLSNTQHRHTVEHVRTETVKTRVSQVGTDIRRATHVSDEVEGTVLHKAGLWLSNTVKEARLHAKAFLFD